MVAVLREEGEAARVEEGLLGDFMEGKRRQGRLSGGGHDHGGGGACCVSPYKGGRQRQEWKMGCKWVVVALGPIRPGEPLFSCFPFLYCLLF